MAGKKVIKKRKRKELKTKIRKQKQLVRIIYNNTPCLICLVLPTCKARYISAVNDTAYEGTAIDVQCEILQTYLYSFKAKGKISPPEANAIARCALAGGNLNYLDQAVERMMSHMWKTWHEMKKSHFRRR
jgi:hypothetical protein